MATWKTRWQDSGKQVVTPTADRCSNTMFSTTLVVPPLSFWLPIKFWLFSFWKILWCFLSSRIFCQYEGFSCSLSQMTPRPFQNPFRWSLNAMTVYRGSDVMPGSKGAGRECGWEWDKTGHELVTVELGNGHRGVDGIMFEIFLHEKNFKLKPPLLLYCVLSSVIFCWRAQKLGWSQKTYPNPQFQIAFWDILPKDRYNETRPPPFFWEAAGAGRENVLVH